MTQLIIDTNDAPAILRASRNMLNELLGEDTLVSEMHLETHIHKAGSDNAGSTDTSRGKAAGPGGGGAGGGGAGDETAVRKDTKGVIFDPEFCGEATEPFYGSGKRGGQWKKKRGAVTEEAYDEWYAAQVARIAAGNDAGDDKPIDTSGAFGGGDDQLAGDPAPEDCGAFMGWVSAKQAAGLLTQDDIGAAYSQAGVQVTDLFPPNDEATVKQNVAELYDILVVKAGA